LFVGDLATRDREGYYYIVDRVKELIKYKVSLACCHRAFRKLMSGFIGLPRQYYFMPSNIVQMLIQLSTVPPAELEAVLLQHPDIVDAAVIGVYSEIDVTELPRLPIFAS
jgi:4-coumarate--CoA ligase